MNQSASQSVSQSINQSIRQLVSQSVSELAIQNVCMLISLSAKSMHIRCLVVTLAIDYNPPPVAPFNVAGAAVRGG